MPKISETGERRMIMAKCTGVRCPMQYGYKVEECNQMDCPYRTEPITNADRIRAMSDEEMAKWLVKKTKYKESAWSEPSYLNFLTESDDTLESAIKGTTEWLKQPAE